MRIRSMPFAFAAFAALALGAAPSSGEKPHSKLSFSESYRFESKTTKDDNSSETDTASVAKWTINAEIPLNQIGSALGPDTALALKVGGVLFEGALKDDPKYHPGDTSARVALTQPVGSGNARTVLALAELSWDKDKLKVKLQAKSPGVASVAADDFKDQLPGAFKGETKAVIQLGDLRDELTVPFTGRLNRKSVDVGFLSGEAVTIDLKGNSEDAKG